MKNWFLALTWAFSVNVMAQATVEQPDRADVTKHYNLGDGRLGLKGFDPVGVMDANTVLAGSPNISVVYGGVTYNFISVANRNAFNANPTKYEPTYGGWCAWAMANESYADIDPRFFTIKNGRAHYFISRGAKARFDDPSRTEVLEMRADRFWTNESGESPRLAR
jgi:YHS domain-containing protein